MIDILQCVNCCTKLHKKYIQIFDSIAEKYDLTSCDIEIIIYLSYGSDKNTCKDISEYWGCSKALISRSVEDLFNKNIIALIPETHDKRYLHITLEKEAKSIVDEINQVKEAFWERLFYGYEQKQIDEFTVMISKMWHNVENFPIK